MKISSRQFSCYAVFSSFAQRICLMFRQVTIAMTSATLNDELVISEIYFIIDISKMCSSNPFGSWSMLWVIKSPQSAQTVLYLEAVIWSFEIIFLDGRVVKELRMGREIALSVILSLLKQDSMLNLALVHIAFQCGWILVKKICFTGSFISDLVLAFVFVFHIQKFHFCITLADLW